MNTFRRRLARVLIAALAAVGLAAVATAAARPGAGQSTPTAGAVTDDRITGNHNQVLI